MMDNTTILRDPCDCADEFSVSDVLLDDFVYEFQSSCSIPPVLSIIRPDMGPTSTGM